MLKEGVRVALVILLLLTAGCATADESKDRLSPDTPAQGTHVSSVKTLQVGKTVRVENDCEFALDTVEFTPVVKPPRPGDYYDYYRVRSNDSTYLHIVAYIKNLGTVEREADEFAEINAIYDDKYTYDGYTVLEEPDGSDFAIVEDIPPLGTGRVHFLIEVPKEVERNSEKSLGFVLSIDDEKYQYRIR